MWQNIGNKNIEGSPLKSKQVLCYRPELYYATWKGYSLLSKNLQLEWTEIIYMIFSNINFFFTFKYSYFLVSSLTVTLSEKDLLNHCYFAFIRQLEFFTRERYFWVYLNFRQLLFKLRCCPIPIHFLTKIKNLKPDFLTAKFQANEVIL